MQQISKRAAASFAAAAVPFFVHAVPAHAQSTPVPVASSSAYGLEAHSFTADFGATLGPVTRVAGSAPPAYNKTKNVASFSGSIGLSPILVRVPTLYATATGLVSKAASAGIGLDFISASASSTVAGANLVLQNFPPPPDIVPLPFLSVTANGVASSASFTEVFPSARNGSGTASFTSLAISGSLLDDIVVGTSGTPPPNTVLFDNGTLTVTVNQQVTAGVISCVEVCKLTPTGITVDALDIHFNKVVLDGQSFTGDIVLGNAQATVPLQAATSATE